MKNCTAITGTFYTLSVRLLRYEFSILFSPVTLWFNGFATNFLKVINLGWHKGQTKGIWGGRCTAALQIQDAKLLWSVNGSVHGALQKSGISSRVSYCDRFSIHCDPDQDKVETEIWMVY